jgi:hypothetical protein
MDSPPAFMHTFIIKIWLEELGAEAGQPEWRGHVTHIPSQRRRHVRDFEGIQQFIQQTISLGKRVDEI